jgi:hypothetical protein
MGSEMIAAMTPQARGRCERVFGTWQGRLPQELRLRKITTVEGANAYLPDWIAREHNRKFTVPARESGTAFVPYFGTELDKIWSNQQERIVGNDNTVSFQKLRLQIPQQTFRFSLARCRVLVCQHLDSTISLHYGPHRLGSYDADGKLLPISIAKTSHAITPPILRSSPINDPGAETVRNEGRKQIQNRQNQRRRKKAA